jgi:hypothetical protein
VKHHVVFLGKSAINIHQSAMALPLPLFVPWVGADHAHHVFALHDLARYTEPFY